MQLDHIHCCEDEQMALCGASLVGVPVATDISEPEYMCVPCESLLYLNRCPHLGDCPHSPGNQQQGETE
jgi:hypothetical protein